MHNAVNAMPCRKAPGVWFTTSLFPFSNGPRKQLFQKYAKMQCKSYALSKSESSTSAPEQKFRAAQLHLGVAVVDVGANVGADLLSIQRAQTVHFCCYVQTLIANGFVVFAAKLHFICILAIALESSCWLQGLLLSTDRVKMRISCVQIVYIC